MKNFKQLTAWQKSKELVLEIYKVSKLLPEDEKFGLSSQIRRAAVSISSNIAEGSSRKSDKDYVRFLEMALGSSFELETQLLIIKELELEIESKLSTCSSLLEEVQKMLHAFISSIEKSKKITYELKA